MIVKCRQCGKTIDRPSKEYNICSACAKKKLLETLKPYPDLQKEIHNYFKEQADYYGKKIKEETHEKF